MTKLAKHNLILFISLCVSLFATAENKENMDVTLCGTQYRAIKAKKGDSLFGLSQSHGWDYETFSRLNPDAGVNITNGMKLYYPIAKVTEDTTPNPLDLPSPTLEIKYTVKKGDNVYSVAKTYGLTPDDIYLSNPLSRQGLVPGMELTIPTKGEWVYVKVDENTSLYDLARQYRSTVADIFRRNPGLDTEGLRIGEIIRIKAGADSVYYKQTPKTENVVDHFKIYKAQKGESWSGIAQNLNLTLDDIIAANPDVKWIKSNTLISYPVYREEQRLATSYEEDVRQQSPIGQKAIYKEVNPIVDETTASIGIVLENPEQIRDKDFLRGFLLALDEMKKSGHRINLKVFNNTETPVLENLTMLDSLDVLVSLFNELSYELSEEANKRFVEVVNVYDMKNDLHLTLPNIMQVMTSSDSFNEAVAQYVATNFNDHFLISVDQPEELDKVSTTIMRSLGRSTLNLTAEEFAEYEFSPTDKYVVFSYAKTKADSAPVTTRIAEVLEGNPYLDITLFGPTDWVLFADKSQESFCAAHVQFPSRMYFDENAPESVKMTDSFKDRFNTKPTRMYPQAGVLGYDIGKFIIKSLVKNGGDFNKGFADTESLILPLHLQRNNNWTGFYNPASLILRFKPTGSVEKIIIE